MIKKIHAVHALALAAFMAGSACAADGGVEVKLSGYGTVAATVTDSSDVAFRNNVWKTKGVSNSVDIGNDSRFGVQAVVFFNKQLSFTGQLVGQRRMTGVEDADFGKDKDLDPKVEWFYAQYAVTPGFNVRLGRSVLPAFLLSDSLNVGYAAPWLRAPMHLYASQALSTLDGVQLNWRDSLGGFNVGVQGSYGKSNGEYQLPILGSQTIQSEDTYGLNMVVERGNWLGRIGMVKAATPGRFGSVKDKYIGAGMQYDDGQLIVMGEVAKRDQNKFAQIGNVAFITGKYAYLAGGWRFGSVLPMIMWSKADHEQANLAGSTVVAHPKSLGLSLRYDIAPNVALKAQSDQYKANDPLAFVTPSTTSDSIKVLTVGVDFVF